MFAWIIVVVLVIGVVLAIQMFKKRSAQQRAAHDARLRMMAQATLNAMKKKQAAQAAAAKDAATAAPGGREERDCPYCAEPILKKARVCKHCGRDVTPIPSE